MRRFSVPLALCCALGLAPILGCGGADPSSSAASAAAQTTAGGTKAEAPSLVGEAVAALNDPSAGLRVAWAKSVGDPSADPANLAAPSVILAPGYTCELVSTRAGVSLILQEPGANSLPTIFDWTRSGGVVSQPTVPASVPASGTPCALSDQWVVSLK